MLAEAAVILSKDELETKFKQLRSGDLNGLPPLQYHFIPMALNIARFFRQGDNDKFEDIQGAAFLGLSEALMRIIDLENTTNDNLSGFVYKWIFYTVKTFIRQDHLVPVPRSQFAKEMARKGEFQIENVLPLMPVSVTEIHPDFEIPAPPTIRKFELYDLFKFLELSESETTILQLKIARYTNREIGEKIGKSHTHVKDVIKELRRRWLVKNG